MWQMYSTACLGVCPHVEDGDGGCAVSIVQVARSGVTYEYGVCVPQ